MTEIQALKRRDEVLSFLQQRRSRPAKTLAAPFPTQEALQPLLEIALRTPDHGKLEPWRLIVLSEPRLKALAKLTEQRGSALGLDQSKLKKSTMSFETAGCVVAVVAAPKASDKIPQEEQLLSAGALCQNLLITFLAAGWGANWLTGWMAFDRHFLTEGLNLEPTEWVAGFIHIGTETLLPPERPRPDASTLITWD